MRVFRSVIGVAAAAVLTAVPFACSSIPELRFDQPGAEGGAGPDAVNTADRQGYDGQRLDVVAIDQFQPPACQAPAGGTCCGAKICKNCGNPADCTKCESASCAGTETDACCMSTGGGPKTITCTAFSACP